MVTDRCVRCNSENVEMIYGSESILYRLYLNVAGLIGAKTLLGKPKYSPANRLSQLLECKKCGAHFFHISWSIKDVKK